MPEETEETTEELIPEETPDYSGDIEEVREFTRDHTHKGIDTPRIRSEDIVRKLDSGARAYVGSTQTLTNNVITKISMDSETFDIVGEFDSTTNYRFTVNKEGYYQINASLEWNPTTENKQYTIYIYKNGAEHSHVFNAAPAPGEHFATVIAEVIKLIKGDYIEIYGRQLSGGNEAIEHGATKSFFSIYKIF